jgi:hypothetical protein
VVEMLLYDLALEDSMTAKEQSVKPAVVETPRPLAGKLISWA